MALTLSSVDAVLQRIAGAHDVAFGTYFLPPGEVRDALVAAARRGAHVAVTLQADPYENPYGARANAEAARELGEAGAVVTSLPSDSVPFHLKAAVCDGTAYLDDRNWTRRGPEIVLADDAPDDARLVREALSGHGGANVTLATRKDEALRRELDVVRASGNGPVIVETEYVAASPLTRALRERARHGAPTTLVVGRGHRSPNEGRAIARLRADGVDVRTGGTNEKLALAGDTAWIGSGNATGAVGRAAAQLEWGLSTRAREVVGAVRSALLRDAPNAVGLAVR